MTWIHCDHLWVTFWLLMISLDTFYWTWAWLSDHHDQKDDHWTHLIRQHALVTGEHCEILIWSYKKKFQEKKVNVTHLGLIYFTENVTLNINVNRKEERFCIRYHFAWYCWLTLKVINVLLKVTKWDFLMQAFSLSNKFSL